MVAFTRQLDITFKCIHIEKKHIADTVEASGKLSKQLASFIRENYTDFLTYDKIKVYYDNGQIELTKVLTGVFSTLSAFVEFRKVKPEDYKLFQVADLICTTELLEEKSALTHSEREFFGSKRDFKKNYLKPIKKKEL